MVSSRADTCVVRCRPQLAENVGMGIRAMLNFGLKHLRIVSDINFSQSQKCYLASGEYAHLLESFETFRSLEDALCDVQQAYAITARVRKMSVLETDLSEISEQGLRAALVFGCEKSGLSNSEIALCSRVVHIPSDAACPSLNLSHAIAVVCYQLSQNTLLQTEARQQPHYERVRHADFSFTMKFLRDELSKRHYFYDAQKQDAMMQTLRTIFEKAELSVQENKSLLGALRALTEPSDG